MGPRLGLHGEVDPPAQRACGGAVCPLWGYHHLREGQPDVLHVPWGRAQPDPICDRLVHEVQSRASGEPWSNTGMVLADSPSRASGRAGVRPRPGHLCQHHTTRPHRPMGGIRVDRQDRCHRCDSGRGVPRTVQDGSHVHRDFRGHHPGIHRGAGRGVRRR